MRSAKFLVQTYLNKYDQMLSWLLFSHPCHFCYWEKGTAHFFTYSYKHHSWMFANSIQLKRYFKPRNEKELRCKYMGAFTGALVHWEAYPLSRQSSPGPVSPVIGSHSLAVRAAELRGPVNWMCLDLWGLGWLALHLWGKPLYTTSKSRLFVLHQPHIFLVLCI